jgi:hypothetical protein
MYNVLDIVLDNETARLLDEKRINATFMKEMKLAGTQGRDMSNGKSVKLYDHIKDIVAESPASIAMQAGFQASMFSDSVGDAVLDYVTYNSRSQEKGNDFLTGIRLGDMAFKNNLYHRMSDAFVEPSQS